MLKFQSHGVMESQSLSVRESQRLSVSAVRSQGWR